MISSNQATCPVIKTGTTTRNNNSYRPPSASRFLAPVHNFTFPELVRYYCSDEGFVEWCRNWPTTQHVYSEIISTLDKHQCDHFTVNDLIHVLPRYKFYKYGQQLSVTSLDYDLFVLYNRTMVLRKDDGHYKSLSSDARYHMVKQHFIDNPALVGLPLSTTYLDGWVMDISELYILLSNWAWHRILKTQRPKVVSRTTSAYLISAQVDMLYDMAAAGWFEDEQVKTEC